jgi:hypothetical protein
MKNLKTYRMFESSVELAPEQIEWLDKCTEGTWQLNSRTGLVDVDGSFHCDDQGLSDFKGVRFGKVGGYFSCHYNQLTSLVGAPQKVGRGFSCRNNQLTTLEGAPRKVGVGFYGEDNPVSEKTLESIFGIMEIGKGYLESVEYLWAGIPLEDQALLYRPEFEWVVDDEKRKLDALRAYQGFKGMI